MTAAPVSVADKEFDVEFLEPGGVVRRADLSTCWGVRFEDVPPVRSFPSLRGQAHFPGLRWSATSGRHVGYESWLERDHAMLLDFDPEVVGYLHQYFEPTARAIDGLEKALAGLGLLDDALTLDLRKPQDYFHRIWNTAFRATDLADTAAGKATA